MRPATCYLYFVYGMHWCANIVTGPPGEPSAVLLRAGEVVDGLDVARARRPAVRRDSQLASGPARLAAVLGWGDRDRALRAYGGDLCSAPAVAEAFRREGSAAAEAVAVSVGPRVGVAAAKDEPLRFWIAGDPTVSAYRPQVPRGQGDPDDSVPAGAVRQDGRVTSLFDDLTWRGLIQQSTGTGDALRAVLDGPPITFYVGFDPTAPSLHIGNLVQLLTARRIQNGGHFPLGLVGGSTGLIGDPRMSGERVLNSPEVVAGWVGKIRVQVEKYLDFEGANAARIVNNLDWTAPMSAIEFLRDVGKHFRMGRMLAKETVAARLNSDDGLSFTEFSYQILQGMDYLELFRRYGCTLQTGGSDQWGNLISGTELIHKVEAADAHALATPLITKADGTKFGKTEGGTVWLDGSMTSPWTFYQFWINADDRDVIGYLKVFSFRSREEIDELATATAERPHAREAQRALAADVTTLVHGEAATASAIAASTALFGRGELNAIDESTLNAALAEAGATEVDQLTDVVDLLTTSKLVASRSEARRALADGGVYVNNNRITDAGHVPAAGDLLPGRWLVLRRGKRSIAGIRLAR